LKVLLCHNFYQQAGGEDQSFAEEASLLESRGHEVIRFTRHNDSIKEMTSWDVATRTFWSRESHRELTSILQQQKPSVMHCTNTFPLISPAAYYAARTERVAVVQSLRNYRMFCPGTYLMRDGKVCEDCLGRTFAWPAILHKCYRNSRAGSAVLTSMNAFHNARGTWSNLVDRYFALTNFSRAKFIQAGLPGEKIDVKPNFLLKDPGAGTGASGFAVFVGRLSAEKGVEILLKAWTQMESPPLLKIVGDGPMAAAVNEAAQNHPNTIQWLGRLDREAVLNQVGEAACLIQPSLWYEGFPRTILEAFARGTPVIASRLGSMEEIVQDRKCGILCEPNVLDLKLAIEGFFTNSEAIPAMRVAARAKFEQEYSATSNYEKLMAIYSNAIAMKSKKVRM
jgi:glycosyltransferase involved in cell wall biosynthesis